MSTRLRSVAAGLCQARVEMSPFLTSLEVSPFLWTSYTAPLSLDFLSRFGEILFFRIRYLSGRLSAVRLLGVLAFGKGFGWPLVPAK